MATYTTDIAYQDLTLPPGSPGVSRYVFTLTDAAGQAVGEPIAADPPGPASLEFSLGPGMYTLHGQALDASGGHVGPQIDSDVLTILPDMIVRVVATITCRKV